MQNTKREMIKMAYTKRIPPIKLVLTKKEYNNLIEIFTRCITDAKEEEIKQLANQTKEKLLKYSIPREKDDKSIEIDTRLYINEAADIISLLLSYLRPIVAQVISASKYGTYNIPFVNFTKPMN